MDSNSSSPLSSTGSTSSNDSELHRITNSIANLGINMDTSDSTSQVTPEPVPVPVVDMAIFQQMFLAQNEAMRAGFAALGEQYQQLLNVVVASKEKPSQNPVAGVPVVDPGTSVQDPLGPNPVSRNQTQMTWTTKLKLPDLDKYDGRRTDDGCYDWIRSVRNIIEADEAFREKNTNPTQLLTYVASHLQKDALAWWDGVKKRDLYAAPGVKLPSTVDELFEEMEKYFTPMDLQARLRTKWKNLKQGPKMTINELRTEYNRLINRIKPPIPVQEQSQKVLDALNPWRNESVLHEIRFPQADGTTAVKDNVFPDPDYLFQLAAISETIWNESNDRKKELTREKDRKRGEFARLNNAKVKGSGVDVSGIECYNCHEKGHYASTCSARPAGENSRGSSRGRGRGRDRGGGRGRGKKGRGGKLNATRAVEPLDDNEEESSNDDEESKN